jgi:hypothetical protein
MDESPVATIETAINDADGILRHRLADHGLEHTDYVMLVLAPDGEAVIRSNCGPVELREMASLLKEIADQVEADGSMRPH